MFKRVKILALSLVLTTGALVGCTKKYEVKDEDIKVTLILTEGGVNDQSFNQSAWEGAEEAAKEYGVEISYLECKQKSEYSSNIEIAVDNDSDLIIGVGYEMADVIKIAAEAYPEQKFAVVDGSYEKIPSNVKSILFDEQGAGYSVGLIAGKMTKTNNIGFIGGMDIPSVSNFAVGFEKGLKEINPKIQLTTQYANSFTDAAKGKAISQQMIQSGVDIIFTAGGGVNSGVIEASKEIGTKVIGVDMPMNYIEPSTIITSALKNVNTGVKLTIKDLVDDRFVGGTSQIYDLSNGGVGFEKTDLIPEETIKYVEKKLK